MSLQTEILPPELNSNQFLIAQLNTQGECWRVEEKTEFKVRNLLAKLCLSDNYVVRHSILKNLRRPNGTSLK